MSNIVIFGGTFDPIHNGHLRIAEVAAKKLNASVLFVPAKSPRWKNPQETSNQRLDMLKIALKDVPYKHKICEYEIRSKDIVNYSIKTVRYLTKKYKRHKLYFLIGADQVNNFPKWQEAKEISELVQIVYTERPRYILDLDVIEEFNMKSLEFSESGDVSSSAIRDMESIDLPFNVLKYIEDKRIYFVKKLKKYLPEKRLNHSISVANLALEVAISNKLEPLEKYYFAALFHDLGKTYCSEDENMISIMKEHYPEYFDFPRFSYHQFVGEYLAKNDFGITDPEFLDAIKFHCTGKASMTRLGMIVYTCDKIEPTRDFDSTWLIDATLKDWKNGFLTTLEDNRKYLIEHNKNISNKLTDECFKMYLK